MDTSPQARGDAAAPKIWRIERDRDADGVPLVAAAIHDGHETRPEVTDRFALGEADRLREEDPFTAVWTAAVAPTRIVGLRSRFEVDLNRPREKAVYRTPEDAWGLTVWRGGPPPDDLLGRSLAAYDAFYAEVRALFEEMAARHGRFVVYDLHTYNHRREGPDGAPADPEANPEVNVGTGTLHDRAPWAAVIDRFAGDLSAFEFPGRGALTVRENVKFKGGQFARWTHTTFPESACVLSVEFKKFFMDEWTGEKDSAVTEAIGTALAATVPGVLEALRGQ